MYNESWIDRHFGLTVGLIVAGLAAFLIPLAMWSDSVGCQERWADSGISSRWSMMGGCRVKLPDGSWVPENLLKAVRVVP